MKKFSTLLKITSVLILFSMASCSFPAISQYPASSQPLAAGQTLVTADPNASPTPTPFQPLSPTKVINPTSEPTSATTTSGLPLLPKPEGQINILVLGSDWRPNGGYRTDVILLFGLNTRKKTVSVISFPRDLWVDIPGYGQQRINVAQAFGGFETMADTLEQNFGVRPDRYIMTNFAGFEGIIDSLGGITVEAAKNLTDRCDLPQAINKYCSVGPGSETMDGAEALWYVRSRYSTDDFDRTRRAQEVMQGVFRKIVSLDGLTRVPELYQAYQSSVETDLTLADITSLIPLATALGDGSSVNRYTIDRTLVTPWITNQGADVQIPNTEAIWEIIKKAFFDQ
jgi:LCP family protein required for cell wall assembly